MGFRGKCVSLLIVYLAGFASAIYWLGPAPPTPQTNATHEAQQPQANQNASAQRIACAINTGMHKCVDLGKEAAEKIAGRIKEKIKEARRPKSDSDLDS